MQQSSESGKRMRRCERIARRVLSFPQFDDPKWPKMLIFIRPLTLADRRHAFPTGRSRCRALRSLTLALDPC